MDRTTENSGRPQVIDIVVVAYRNDIFFLELQARSISLYIDPDRIANIYVCINDDDEYCNQANPAWWGNNSHKVKIIPRSYFGVDPTLDGWSSQQLYKLLLANQAKSTWSMCLDAKTWFVNPLQWDLIFDTQGRAKFSSFPTIPVFKSAEVFVNKYYNIDNDKVIGPGGVPFLFHTETVVEMCREIENFFKFFVTYVIYPHLITEFVLYSGYVFKKYNSLNVLYSTSQHYHIINIADFEIDQYDELLQHMQDKSVLTASVHERVYKLISDDQFYTWIDFLKTRNILSQNDELVQKLNTLRQQIKE